MASDSIVISLPPDASAETVERVKAAFPDAQIAAEEAPVETASAAIDAEAALAAAVGAAPGLADALGNWLQAVPGGAMSLVWIAVAIIAAYGVERAVRAVFARQDPAEAEEGASFMARFTKGMRWLAGRLVSIVIFVLAARMIGRMLLPAEPALRDLGLGLLGAVLFARLVYALISALAAPDAPGRRIMGFIQANAERVMQVTTVAVAILLVVRLIRVCVIDAAGTGPEAQLALLVLALLNGVVAAYFFVALRRPVAEFIQRDLNADEDTPPGWRHWLARRWHWPFLFCVVIDTALKCLGVLGLLGDQAADGAGPALLVLMLSTLTIAGIRVLQDEPEIQERGALVAGGLTLLEGLVMVGAAILLLAVWGIDPFQPRAESGIGRLLPALVEAAILVVIGIALWRVLSAFLTSRGDEDGGEDDGGDGMGGEGSRLETMLPILRGFGLTAIGIVTGMSALTALGINIGPLIASAGVVGLAIGFGAQKLVTDIISGMFYLYEDAFRLGEYIVTDGGKGTVEKISLRSARIRHHNGPIYTVPFSAMGTIQNHSRDYVVMKFSFAVPDDTDVEMVRKLVKKAGQELAADPELEGKLIAPLKSQGAISIQGRSYQIGCKFTARPGQQFVIRRKAYVVLQKALKEKGVELFMPSLMLSTDAPAVPGAAPPPPA